MALTIIVDVSAIVDGQNADAADALTPIGNLKTAIENMLNAIQAFDAQRLNEIATPSNPAAGQHKYYFKADGNGYVLNSAGVESLAFSVATSIDIVQYRCFT